MAAEFLVEKVIKAVDGIKRTANSMGTSDFLLDDEIAWLKASKEIVKRLRDQAQSSEEFLALSLSDQATTMATVNGVLIDFAMKVIRNERAKKHKISSETVQSSQAAPESATTIGRQSTSQQLGNKIIPPVCYLCNKRHFLYYCREFMRMRVGNRLSYIREHRLCVNCFNFRHPTSKCPKPPRCLYCKSKHHSELHGAFVNMQ